MLLVRIIEEDFDPAAEERRIAPPRTGAGAIVAFTGYVRAQTADQNAVEGLYLEAYPDLTEKLIRVRAEREIAARALLAVNIVHRTGTLRPGEPIVLVAVAASHRRAAFLAADALMDYLKSEALFWKKEITAHGGQWIEPTAADYADAQRWRHDDGRY